MKITVKYYGAFRAFGHCALMDVPAPITVRVIKDALVTFLGAEHKALIDDSVLANETNILQDDFVIAGDCMVSILPPVCGG